VIQELRFHAARLLFMRRLFAFLASAEAEHDSSRGRLMVELFDTGQGRKPRHWSWQVRVPVFTGRVQVGFVSCLRAPIYDQRLLSPQEAFHSTGKWPPYYEARLHGA
jgi:hypothetical protein